MSVPELFADVEPTYAPPPARPEWWMVLACYAPDGHWKLFRDQWLSREAAEKFVREMPTFYAHARLVRIGGEGEKRLPALKETAS